MLHNDPAPIPRNTRRAKTSPPPNTRYSLGILVTSCLVEKSKRVRLRESKENHEIRHTVLACSVIVLSRTDSTNFPLSQKVPDCTVWYVLYGFGTLKSENSKLFHVLLQSWLIVPSWPTVNSFRLPRPAGELVFDPACFAKDATFLELVPFWSTFKSNFLWSS